MKWPRKRRKKPSAASRKQRNWTTDFTDFTDKAFGGGDGWPGAVHSAIRAIRAIRGKFFSNMDYFDILHYSRAKAPVRSFLSESALHALFTRAIPSLLSAVRYV